MNVTEYMTGFYLDPFHNKLLTQDAFRIGSPQPHINPETRASGVFSFSDHHSSVQFTQHGYITSADLRKKPDLKTYP